MPIKLGNKDITKIYRGANEVQSVNIGGLLFLAVSANTLFTFEYTFDNLDNAPRHIVKNDTHVFISDIVTHTVSAFNLTSNDIDFIVPSYGATIETMLATNDYLFIGGRNNNVLRFNLSSLQYDLTIDPDFRVTALDIDNDILYIGPRFNNNARAFNLLTNEFTPFLGGTLSTNTNVIIYGNDHLFYSSGMGLRLYEFSTNNSILHLTDLSPTVASAVFEPSENVIYILRNSTTVIESDIIIERLDLDTYVITPIKTFSQAEFEVNTTTDVTPIPNNIIYKNGHFFIEALNGIYEYDLDNDTLSLLAEYGLSDYTVATFYFDNTHAWIRGVNPLTVHGFRWF